jgi:hypothetical protein
MEPAAEAELIIVFDATLAMAASHRALLERTLGPLLDQLLGPAAGMPTECAVLTVRDASPGSSGWGSVSPFTRSATEVRRWLGAVPLEGGLLGPVQSLEALLLVARDAPWKAQRDGMHILLVTASAPLPLPDVAEPETEPWEPVASELAAAQISLSVLSPTALTPLFSLYEACRRARRSKAMPYGYPAAAPTTLASSGHSLWLAAALSRNLVPHTVSSCPPACGTSASPSAAAPARPAIAASPTVVPTSLVAPRAASPGMPSPNFSSLGARPSAAPAPSPRTPSPGPSSSISKLFDGFLLLPTANRKGADQLCQFKLGIRNDNPLKEQWRAAARGWHRSLTITGKRPADDAPPKGRHVAQVQLILTADPPAPDGISPSLTKLMSGRVRLFGDFQPATAEAAPGRVYIETDPAQLASAGRKHYKLVGWLVLLDTPPPGGAKSPPAAGVPASRAAGAKNLAAPSPEIAAPRGSGAAAIAPAPPTSGAPGSTHTRTAAATTEQHSSKRRRVQQC